MTTYNELVKNAINEAKERANKATIVYNHENGVNTVLRFYKKGTAIWCSLVTGSIKNESRVYKVNTEAPYTRWAGRYWYLSDKEIEAMRNAI